MKKKNAELTKKDFIDNGFKKGGNVVDGFYYEKYFNHSFLGRLHIFMHIDDEINTELCMGLKHLIIKMDHPTKENLDEFIKFALS